MQTCSFGVYFCLKWRVGCQTNPNIFTRKIKLNEFQILNKFFLGGGGVAFEHLLFAPNVSIIFFFFFQFYEKIKTVYLKWLLSTIL